LLLALAGSFPAQDKKPVSEKHDAKALHASLRDVINTGAELFNKQGDHGGCYRLYQGALLSVKPFLSPDLQSTIDDGIAAAERMPRMSDRAFALRKVIDDIRAQAGPPQKKGDDLPPKDKKSDDKPPPPKDKKVDDKPPPPKDKKVDDKPPPPKDKKTEAKSLWERLGSEANVRKIVGDFFKTAGPDPKVNVTRDGKFKLDEEGMKNAMNVLVEFISSKTGGPLKYSGQNMKDAHRGMGITNAEYDAAGLHFKAALDKNGVKPADAAEFMRNLDSLRKEIVEVKTKKVDPKKDDAKKADDKKKDEVKKDEVKKDEVKKDEVKKDDTKKVDEKKGEEKKTADKGVKTSDSNAGKVSGRVVYKGKPAPIGYLTLVSADNRRFSTFIGADGAYAFKTPIPPGAYRVVFERAPDQAPSKADIPERFRKEGTSGLTMQVNVGSVIWDIDLPN